MQPMSALLLFPRPACLDCVSLPSAMPVCRSFQDCRLRSNGQYGLHVGGQGSAATCLRVEVTRNDDYAVLVSDRDRSCPSAYDMPL